MAYADYTFYSTTYLGTAIAQADFPRLAARASVLIDLLTFGRAAAVVTAGTDTATIAKIRSATCAVAEVVQKMDESGGVVQSERVGNVQVTYSESRSERGQVREAAKPYLWDSGLMYPSFTDEEL